MGVLKKLFSIENFVKEKDLRGELPSNKETYRTAFQMAWPSSLEMVLIGLIGSLDLIMVSHLGTGSISAIGITTQPKFILMAPLLALNTGVTIVISRRLGQHRQEDANRTLRNAVLMSVVFSLLCTVLGIVFARPLLAFAGAEEAYIEIAIEYFRIIMFGNFFSCIGLTLTAAQRGAGNTKISMVTNITANLVNVVFNYLLINGIWVFPQLGTRGAAIATAIGNIVGMVIAIHSIIKPGFIQLSHHDDWRFDKEVSLELVRMSTSTFIEQIFIRVGFFMYSKLVAGLGQDQFATHQVCMNIINLSYCVGEGLSIAASALVGRSLGEKRPDLAMIYSKVLQRIGLVIAIVLGATLAVFRIPILSIFSSGNEIVVKLGEPIMFIIALAVLMQILQVITIGSLRGGADLKFVALLHIVSVGLVRPLLSYVLTYPLGGQLMGAWLGLLIDQSLRNVFSQVRFKSGNWLGFDI